MKTRSPKNRNIDVNENDRGAVLIWFAAMAVALIGMGSVVVDVGALWSERRQLQNGADAAALAVAADCAFSTCTNSMAMAKQYADFNAQDGGSNVTLLCGNAPGLTPCSPTPPGAGTYRYVHVKTSTWSTSGDNQVRYIMAPILDSANDGQTVTASATVAWGSLATAKVIALVLSKCSFDPAWINADGSTNFPGTPILVTVNAGTTCSGGYPEGYDFVSDSDGLCTSTVTLLNGAQILTKSNEGMTPSCRSVLQNAVTSKQSILIPIATGRTSPGSGTFYTIDGFASVELCGFRVPGSNVDNCRNPDGTVSTVCSSSTSGNKLCGIFRPKTVTEGEIGSGTDYGTRIIKMVG